MNKRIKKIYGILLVLVMLCGVVCADSAIANAAMSKSAQHKLYANTMKMYAKKELLIREMRQVMIWVRV